MIIQPKKICLLTFAFAALIYSCGGKDGKDGVSEKNWDWKSAETEYKLLQAELKLANTEKPYLVIDAADGELAIKLKGIAVWGFPMDIGGTDRGDLNDFVNRFFDKGHFYIRPVTEKHLFAASEKTPDSILAIVGKAVNVEPSLLQREVPERFQLLWGSGLVLDIRTGVAGKPTSRFQNTMAELRRTLQRPFGESQLIIKMTPEEALTLYRAALPGLPTLIYPPQ